MLFQLHFTFCKFQVERRKEENAKAFRASMETMKKSIDEEKRRSKKQESSSSEEDSDESNSDSDESESEEDIRIQVSCSAHKQFSVLPPQNQHIL